MYVFHCSLFKGMCQYTFELKFIENLLDSERTQISSIPYSVFFVRLNLRSAQKIRIFVGLSSVYILLI